MKIINAISTGCWLVAGGFLLAEPTVPATAPAAPAALPADPIAEALPILQAKYADFAALHYKEGDKLSDLATRSGGKISLSMPGTTVPTPIQTASLPDDIAYCRLGSFTPKKDWAGLAAELNTLSSAQHVPGVVIDLRGNASDDYTGAAQVLGFLAPNDASLIKYVVVPKSDGKTTAPNAVVPHLNGPMVVLTNGQTAGAAETLAACLKNDGALVVGRATAGTGFEEDKLANGEIVRFATALHAQPGDNLIRPVTPDIAMTVDDHNEKAALMLIREDRVLDVIQEQADRKRMSEASLVNGQDPEWDAYLATLENAPVLLSLPRIHDPVLVAGLDSVRAIRLAGGVVTAPAAPAGPATQAAAANDAKPANTSVQ